MIVLLIIAAVYLTATYFSGKKMVSYLHNHGAWQMMRMGLPNKITANLQLILTSIAGAIYLNIVALVYLVVLLL